MNWPQLLQSVVTALVIAGIFAVFKLFRDIDRLNTKTEPLLEWWKKTSLDALKLATNPTSERLTELADKYIASVMGSGRITTAEKQELIDGLRAVMEDKNQVPGKRQSASVSLRFIESREHLPLRRGASH
jgi:hypothetical protein